MGPTPMYTHVWLEKVHKPERGETFGKVIPLRTICLFFMYRVFHRFGQAKFAYGGPVLGSSQFLLLPQLPQKMMLASKVVKIDSKIIILLR